jgi:acetyltransferase-like isoleucine patch superfamily enzyme
MLTRLRLLGLLVTAFLPGFLKRPIYRWCFGYRLGKQVKIGIALLDCAQLSVADNARIGHGVAFLRCGEVSIGTHAVIGALNVFRGGEAIYLGDWSQVLRANVINAIPEHDCTNAPRSVFTLGYGAVVTSEHRIDFTDEVKIGRCSILGGRNSSIWTHNRRSGAPVSIGDYCYIGSEIRMAPGACVPDCCVVGLASVVTKAISGPFQLIAGVPAKPRRALTSDDYELIFGKTRPDLPDETYPVLEIERGFHTLKRL